MSDTDKELETGAVEAEKAVATGKGDDITVAQVTNQAEKTAASKKIKTNKDGFFPGVKAEFGKIVWPGRQLLIKGSAVVIVSTVILGLLITAIDLIIRSGLELIIK